MPARDFVDTIVNGGGGRGPRKLVMRAWVGARARVHVRITHLPSCGNPREGQDPALVNAESCSARPAQGHAWVSSVGALTRASVCVCVCHAVACAGASVRVA